MIIAIVQARLGSKRLPGKALKEIKGKPLIAYLMDRLQMCRNLDAIKVAVPARDAKKISAALIGYECEVVGVPGDQNDVARRFRYVMTRSNYPLPKAFVRICADSPLIDPAVVDYMIERFKSPENKGMIVTNTQPRTWPGGQCVEIIPAGGFIRGLRRVGYTPTAYDREHVTPAFYKNCTFNNIECPDGDFSNVSMVVDTQEDFDKLEGIVKRMGCEHWTYGWRDIVEMVQ